MSIRDDDEVLARWRREARRALPGADVEFVEEVAQHVADRWLAARGSGESEAAADARAMADLAQWRHRTIPERRSAPARAAAWIGIGADVRGAIRSLRVNPLFTVGAALLSAIAVAAITAGVTVIYGILWRPLPFPDAGRLAVVWQVHAGEETQISFPDFRDVAAASVFDAASAVTGGRGSLRIDGRIERINVLELEPSGYAMLGARPALGRLLTPADAGTSRALISHRLWRTHLRSDPEVIGRMLWLSGREYEVTGVLPPGFDFELPVPPFFTREANDLWTLLDASYPFTARRDVSGYEGLVRLAPGRTLQEAQAAADAIADRLAAEHASTNAGRTFRVASLGDEVTGDIRRPLLLVALGCFIMLLVAAANLGILGLLRASERQAEFSIRQALGAGSLRLRRQLLAEHLAIAICGAVFGVLLARELVARLVASEAADLPRADAIQFDAWSWIAAAIVALVVALTLTAQPLASAPAALRAGGRSVGPAARRSRRLMVAMEVALALTLSTAGAFLALSVSRLAAVDAGFDPTRSAAARVSAYDARYPQRDDVVRMFDDVLGDLRRSGQVAEAGAGSSLPLSGQNSGTSIVAEGQAATAAERPTAGWQFITHGYVGAAGMRLLAGRDFTDADRRGGGHVTIISEGLARALFGGDDPIGRRIGVGGGDVSGDWHEIVGVVADVRHQALDTAPTPRVYDLFGQHWGRTLYVVARSSGTDPAALPSVVRRIVNAADPDAPVFETTTMQALVNRSAAGRRLASTIALGVAPAGVLLALIGVYAVMAATVAERTKEIGVRAALGAAPRDLFRLIGAEGGRTVLWGAMAGIVASIAVARLIDSQLFDSRAWDAAWLIPLVAAGIAAAALLAAVPPGRRAASVDPLVAMRVE